MSEANLVWDIRSVLGEGPLWSARDQSVYWVDIKGCMLHRYGFDGRQQSWTMPDYIGWIVERRDQPGFVAGFRNFVAELSLSPFSIRERFKPEPKLQGNRLNDAKADAAGRIWFGSMDDAEKAASGAFYRLDPDFSYHQVDSDYICANGPTFSPDGKLVYHTDSLRNEIYQFDVKADGTLANKRLFARFEAEDGSPDGMTTDAEGFLWVALWGGWGIVRFDPAGKRERFIPLPVSQVTSCCFAGDALDRLFVTSARIGLTPEQLHKEPHAGSFFEIEPGVVGLPTAAFAG
ncbi:MAG TPA: SMP-30/gluconolactonase/LRE family protein [Terriglobia bacterium]|nr:SMP-30/gluconolactonase/LRE family protein [Terriglobia bacterium]